MSNPYGPDPYAERSSDPYEAYVQSSPYGAPMVRQHPRSTPILVLGLLSILGLSICGPIAWVMGNNAMREIDASPVAARSTSDASSASSGPCCSS